MEDMWLKYVLAIDGFQLKLLVALVIGYFLLSVVVTIMDRKCRAEILTNTIDKSLVPVYGGLTMVAFISLVHPQWESMIPEVWLVLHLMVIGLMLAKAGELGLPIPNVQGWLKR